MTFVKGKSDNPNDVIYTPEPVAKEIIGMFNLSGKVSKLLYGDVTVYGEVTR